MSKLRNDNLKSSLDIRGNCLVLLIVIAFCAASSYSSAGIWDVVDILSSDDDKDKVNGIVKDTGKPFFEGHEDPLFGNKGDKESVENENSSLQDNDAPLSSFEEKHGRNVALTVEEGKPQKKAVIQKKHVGEKNNVEDRSLEMLDKIEDNLENTAERINKVGEGVSEITETMRKILENRILQEKLMNEYLENFKNYKDENADQDNKKTYEAQKQRDAKTLEYLNDLKKKGQEQREQAVDEVAEQRYQARLKAEAKRRTERLEALWKKWRKIEEQDSKVWEAQLEARKQRDSEAITYFNDLKKKGQEQREQAVEEVAEQRYQARLKAKAKKRRAERLEALWKKWRKIEERDSKFWQEQVNARKERDQEALAYFQHLQERGKEDRHKRAKELANEYYAEYQKRQDEERRIHAEQLLADQKLWAERKEEARDELARQKYEEKLTAERDALDKKRIKWGCDVTHCTGEAAHKKWLNKQLSPDDGSWWSWTKSVAESIVDTVLIDDDGSYVMSGLISRFRFSEPTTTSLVSSGEVTDHTFEGAVERKQHYRMKLADQKLWQERKEEARKKLPLQRRSDLKKQREDRNARKLEVKQHKARIRSDQSAIVEYKAEVARKQKLRSENGMFYTAEVLRDMSVVDDEIQRDSKAGSFQKRVDRDYPVALKESSDVVYDSVRQHMREAQKQRNTDKSNIREQQIERTLISSRTDAIGEAVIAPNGTVSASGVSVPAQPETQEERGWFYYPKMLFNILAAKDDNGTIPSGLIGNNPLRSEDKVVSNASITVNDSSVDDVCDPIEAPQPLDKNISTPISFRANVSKEVDVMARNESAIALQPSPTLKSPGARKSEEDSGWFSFPKALYNIFTANDNNQILSSGMITSDPVVTKENVGTNTSDATTFSLRGAFTSHNPKQPPQPQPLNSESEEESSWLSYPMAVAQFFIEDDGGEKIKGLISSFLSTKTESVKVPGAQSASSAEAGVGVRHNLKAARQKNDAQTSENDSGWFSFPKALYNIFTANDNNQTLSSGVITSDPVVAKGNVGNTSDATTFSLRGALTSHNPKQPPQPQAQPLNSESEEESSWLSYPMAVAQFFIEDDGGEKIKGLISSFLSTNKESVKVPGAQSAFSAEAGVGVRHNPKAARQKNDAQTSENDSGWFSFPKALYNIFTANDNNQTLSSGVITSDPVVAKGNVGNTSDATTFSLRGALTSHNPKQPPQPQPQPLNSKSEEESSWLSYPMAVAQFFIEDDGGQKIKGLISSFLSSKKESVEVPSAQNVEGLMTAAPLKGGNHSVTHNASLAAPVETASGNQKGVSKKEGGISGYLKTLWNIVTLNDERESVSNSLITTSPLHTDAGVNYPIVVWESQENTVLNSARKFASEAKKTRAQFDELNQQNKVRDHYRRQKRYHRAQVFEEGLKLKEKEARFQTLDKRNKARDDYRRQNRHHRMHVMNVHMIQMRIEHSSHASLDDDPTNGVGSLTRRRKNVTKAPTWKDVLMPAMAQFPVPSAEENSHASYEVDKIQEAKSQAQSAVKSAGSHAQTEEVVEEEKTEVAEGVAAVEDAAQAETDVIPQPVTAVEASVAQPVFDSALVAALPGTAVEIVNNSAAQMFSGHYQTISNLRSDHLTAGAGIERLDTKSVAQSVNGGLQESLQVGGTYSYVRSYGRIGSAQAASAHPGYANKGYGFELGAFKMIDAELMVGVAGVAENNKASLKAKNGSVDVTSLRVGPFFSWKSTNLHINGALMVGYHEVSAKGRDQISGDSYKGSFSINDWTASIGTGYDIHLDAFVPGLTLTPTAEFTYINSRTSGFELKSDHKHRVKVQGNSQHGRINRFGLMMDYQLPAAQYLTSIHGGFGVQKNHFSDDTIAMISVTGASTTERRKQRDRQLQWYKLGVSSQLTGMRSLSLDMEGSRSRNSRSYSASITFEQKF